MSYKITPKNLILSMFHDSNLEQLPIRTLVEVGKIFGFSDNTVRVTMARLVKDNVLERDQRGLYSMTQRIDPYRRILDSWRLGEQRIKPWDGRWLCCHFSLVPPSQKKSVQKISAMAGFVEARPCLWVRPNNLNLELFRLRELFSRVESREPPLVFVAGEFDPQIAKAWRKSLWPVKKILQALEACRDRLEKSKKRLTSGPWKDALVETYLLGSEAVNLLITDPLLPDEIMDGSQRIWLTQSMLEYDALGKNIWEERFVDLHIKKTPSLV